MIDLEETLDEVYPEGERAPLPFLTPRQTLILLGVFFVLFAGFIVSALRMP